MNRIYTIIIALLSVSTVVKAQETVVWASQVFEVSSETSPLQYSAMQALHKPNFYPSGGDSPNAWKPRKDNKDEFVVVSFEKPIRAQQVAIAETENPGAVKAVYAYDENDNEYLLFELTPRPIPIEARLLNLFFEMTTYEISYMKVEIDGSAVPGYNSIDAIGISASNIPITVLINVASNVNQNAVEERLSNNVNSQYIEHSPILSPDGQRLYFSRQYHPGNVGGVDDNEDIWYSELDESTGEWLPAKNLGAPLNNDGPNFISSVTQDDDGNTIFLLGNRYEKKGRMTTGVSMAMMTPDGTITKPENLEIADYYNYNNNVDQYLSADNKVMLLAIERDDTYGDRDLYVSFKRGGRDWSEPLNIGNEINTADEEGAPFISADNETIYFSSRGHSGRGGLDIFVSKRLDNTWTKWSEPENLGAAMNSEGDDVYFNMPSAGQHVYFTRGDKDENTDIFRFNIDEFFIDETQPVASADVEVDDTEMVADAAADDEYVTVRGNVLDAKTGKPIALSVIVERLPDGARVGETMTTAEDGQYTFKLRKGATYAITAEMDGFIAVDENINPDDVDESGMINLNLTMVPIAQGEKVVLNNIFFDFDKSELKTASYDELDHVLKFLKDGRIKKIEIGGHTDSQGDDAYNKSLSQRRANAVYDYFISKGISADRLKSVGYGESQPVAPNDTIANKSKNRRVEFTIIE